MIWVAFGGRSKTTKMQFCEPQAAGLWQASVSRLCCAHRLADDGYGLSTVLDGLISCFYGYVLGKMLLSELCAM